MRSILAAVTLLLVGSAAAQAQPFFGYPPPPPPPGFGLPHPHPHWHCHDKFDWRGPVRVCRWGW